MYQEQGNTNDMKARPPSDAIDRGGFVMQALGTCPVRTKSKNALITALLMTTAISFGVIASPHVVFAQAAPKTTAYSIPPGSLNGALTAFGRQTGLQVTYLAAVASGKTSPGFSGSATREQALAQILKGSGLSYSFPNSGTVAISGPGSSSAGAAADGATLLDPVDVSGGVSSTDAPYRTPGSSGHISQEQIQRLPPTSVGDMFRNTPGVISAGSRNGQSLDLNIRGLQGMNRIATLVDGAQQTSSTYRGYKGHSNRTFVDSEFIGGIDIEKGPSGGPYGAGAMGGVVNMRTLNANDLVENGKTFGARLRGSFGGNTVAPPAVDTMVQRFGGNELMSTENRMGSAAMAVATEHVDLVAAFAHRSNGNYFAGNNGDSMVALKNPNEGRATMYPMSRYRPGGEVLNTSQDTNSALLKGKVRFGDGHSVELGYVNYNSKFGEEYPDANNPFSRFAWIQQFGLSEVTASTYTAKYHWKPTDNPLVDFHASAWMSDVTDKWVAFGSLSDVVTKGGEVWNTSGFDTAVGALTLKYGGQYSTESVDQRGLPGTIGFSNFKGTRTIGSAFLQSALDLTSWLTLSGGLRYEAYKSQDDSAVNPLKSLEDSRLNPRVGVTVKPWDGFQLFATYTEGWRPPSVRETLLNMPGLLVPNPQLRPETSKNYEYGVNFLRDGIFRSGDKLRVKLAFFDNNYENYIMREYGIFVGVPTTQRVFGNIPSAHFDGIELSGSYDAGRVFIEGNYNYYTNVDFCNPKGNFRNVPCADFTSGADYFSNYIPPQYAGSLTVGTRWMDQKLTVGGRMTFAGARAVGRKDMYSSAVDSDWNPYQVYDLFASYKVDDMVSFNLSVENVFDRYYLDAIATALVPAPGRLMRLGATVKF